VQDLSPLLQQSLIFFAYTTTVVLVVIAFYLIKLLIELSQLTKTSQDIAALVKQELEPTITELQLALKNVNAIASTADEKGEAIKNNVSSIINPLQSNLAKLKLGILKSISKGINVFLNK
jgi:predicted PurR-regulated permease PerM